jgi:hypothetical protein
MTQQVISVPPGAIASLIDSQFASRSCAVSRGRASFSEQ